MLSLLSLYEQIAFQCRASAQMRDIVSDRPLLIRDIGTLPSVTAGRDSREPRSCCPRKIAVATTKFSRGMKNFSRYGRCGRIGTMFTVQASRLSHA
jgi:hypothetical protein